MIRQAPAEEADASRAARESRAAGSLVANPGPDANGPAASVPANSSSSASLGQCNATAAER